jgi:uncharacterized protein
MAATGRPFIEAYGDGGFRVSGARHHGSVLILPDATHRWPIDTFDAVTADSFALILEQQTMIDILLLGCGARLRLVTADLRAPLRTAGITLDAMDTGAACRTYNLLAAEERRVAAALIAV